MSNVTERWLASICGFIALLGSLLSECIERQPTMTGSEFVVVSGLTVEELEKIQASFKAEEKKIDDQIMKLEGLKKDFTTRLQIIAKLILRKKAGYTTEQVQDLRP